MMHSRVPKGRWFSLDKTSLASLCLGMLFSTLPGCVMGTQGEKATVAPEVKEAPPPSASARPEPTQSKITETTLEQQAFQLRELRVQEERGQVIVRVQFSDPVQQYRHFALTTPSRLVLDVFGEAKQLSQVENFRVDTQWVSNLRLSSGEGYLRLVVEVAAANVPAYVIDPEDNGLKIVLGPLNPQATAQRNLQLVKDGKRNDAPAAKAAPAQAAPAQAAASKVPAAEAAAPGEKKYAGQRISLDFKDADIKNVFRLLAEVSGLNIIVTPDVQRKVTVRLVDVPWDQSLDLLVATNGLGKEQMGNVVRISTTDQFKRESDARAAAQKAKQGEEALLTTYLNINYAKAKDLEAKIKPLLSPRGSVVPDERSNTILVRDIQKSIEDVHVLVSKLDVRTPQVAIESNLIETTPSFARALGLELSATARIHQIGNPNRTATTSTGFPAGAPFSATPLSGLSFSIIQDRLGIFRDLTSTLTAAEKEGNIRIISRPSIVTLNNVASTIQSLRILRITLSTSTNIASGAGAAAGSAVATEKIPIGIILTVTPQVSSDNFILMNISVKSSSIADSPTVGTGAAGVVPFDELTREAISNVLVRDGETIVIGGIMKNTSKDSQSGIPYLKDIPVFGWLFKNISWQKDFEELMVFITPRIVAGGSADLPAAEQLWRDQLKKTEGTGS